MTHAPRRFGRAGGRSDHAGTWRAGRLRAVLSPVLPVVLLVAGCGAATGSTVAVSSADSAAGSTQPSWVARPPLPPCPAAAAPDTQLPAVSLRCLGPGPALSLDRLPARPFVINLWASWCEPCRREAPRLAAAAAAAAGRVTFLGVDSDDDRDPALAFVHDFGINYAQLVDPNSYVLHRLSVPGLPVTLAVDATGRVVYRRIGEISAAQLADAVHASDATASASPVGGG